MKKFLMIFDMSPHQNGKASEAFDILLGASAFYDDIRSIFIDDGVWLLLKNQDSAELGQNNISTQLQALPLYEIPMYVSIESLQQRGLREQDIISGTQCVPDGEIKKFLKSDAFIWN